MEQCGSAVRVRVWTYVWLICSSLVPVTDQSALNQWIFFIMTEQQLVRCLAQEHIGMQTKSLESTPQSFSLNKGCSACFCVNSSVDLNKYPWINFYSRQSVCFDTTCFCSYSHLLWGISNEPVTNKHPHTRHFILPWNLKCPDVEPTIYQHSPYHFSSSIVVSLYFPAHYKG